ncbi:histidine kinase [Kineosporia sp. NBRC 101731]|uniref:sensor histidine kinase n=1 Tax=Kineosporia sp. NBRC 101731 TaxID=3032199 RepID=UPI0024A5F5E8|nr:histidine kinase [Kineosporia sp. NBRC 101731]GLY28292.1 two-component sensor histidine kinase [Kineosporia sp. NBRC 101731]
MQWRRLWPEPVVLVATFAMFWIAFGSAGATYDLHATGRGPMFFVALIVAAPLAFVVARPLPALMFSVATAFVLAFTLPVLNDAPWQWLIVQGLIIFVLLFSTAAQHSVRDALGTWVLTSSLFYWGVQPNARSGWVVGLGAIALFGILTGRLLRARRDLQAQTQVSEEERARRRVLEERAQLARDLHDIVAHHMSLVVVQAETAQYRVPDLGDAAREELLSVAETARKALVETRSLLNVLRREDSSAPEAPQPGLHLLPELVESTRRAGVQLDADITGDFAGLREGQSLAAFRIAQEALANATRHAGGAPVRLEARAGEHDVTLTVTSGEPGPVGDPPETGHGIVGMRERAAAAGGRIEVGPTPNGFVVRLHLPSDQSDQEETPDQ